MTDELLTNAEKHAEAAQRLAAFPINLREIRDAVKSILGEVQRYGFFNEYTNHSFEHVTDLLDLTNWLIPEETRKIMTSGDWLLLVLGAYP